MNILIYGNCQGFAVKETLGLSLYNSVIYIPCYNTELVDDAFTEHIENSDIIITQPIRENYRGKEYLSTLYIITHAKPECKIILFDSCHFDFYYFDLTYKWLDTSVFKEPHDYHYNGIIETYRNKQPIDNYIDNYVNNITLKTPIELEELATKSLDELKRRYDNNCDLYKTYSNVSIISTYEFIKTNYKNKLLFYSMNHPTNILIQYICEEIYKIIPKIGQINYSIDALGEYRGILYKCIQPVVNFNIDNYKPLSFKTSSIQEITKIYYDGYDKVGFSTINLLR